MNHDPMIYIGVDPGTKGAICIIDSQGNVLTHFSLSKNTYTDMLLSLSTLSREQPTMAVIEAVSAMPGQGVSSMFKFGEAYGMLQMLLIASGIPFERVAPVKWQRALGLGRNGASKAEHKRALKAKAQELFPGQPINLEIADAFLLAYYAKNHFQLNK